MAKKTPTPVKLPSEGGIYLIDPATGEWVLQSQTQPAPPAASEPETVAPNDDGTAYAEAPAAGED